MAVATQTPARIEIPRAIRDASALRLLTRIQDACIFVSWFFISAFALVHHEKWADEAQAWLIARDLDLVTIWSKELRYEGSPGLWHSMLWVAQHVFHVPYAGLGVIGLLCSALGMALLLVRSPFPTPIRWLMVFSYYFVYQYSAVARPYVLLPLIAFAAAIAFKNPDRPVRFTVILVVLANLSAHGIVLAACLGVAYLCRAICSWSRISLYTRRNYILCAAAMVLVFLGLYIVLKPAPDTEALVDVQRKSASLIAWRIWDGINRAFFDATPLTVLWLTILGMWCFVRRTAHSYLIPVLMISMAVFYGFYGWPHHIGTIFIAAVTGLWIAWPSGDELDRCTPKNRVIHQSLCYALLVLLAYHGWNAAVAVRNEYYTPYSGARDVAEYMKRVGGEHPRVIGFGYGMVAIEAYFDRNIEVNRPAAYYHHGYPDTEYVFAGTDELRELSPDFLIVPCFVKDCESLKEKYSAYGSSVGYPLVRFSDGYLMEKRGWYTRHAFFTFQRSSSAQKSAQ